MNITCGIIGRKGVRVASDYRILGGSEFVQGASGTYII
jgi:hypothetical protein